MLSVDRPSTECRPITDRYIGQVSTNYRPTIGEVSAKCRRKVGEVLVNEKLYRPRHIWNDYRPCLDRASTDYRPTIDRYIDRLSTEYRPTVDRLSTECRPLYRPISRSTLPTVNKIRKMNDFFLLKETSFLTLRFRKAQVYRSIAYRSK